MDGDPSVEAELDGFSRTLPLPYRVALITVLATWGWGANLHYLYRQKIDVPSLIRYPSRPSSLPLSSSLSLSPTPSSSPSTTSHLTHHDSAYRLATATSSVLAASLLLFWLLTRRDPDLVLAYDWLPMTTLGLLGLLLVLPFPAALLRRIGHQTRRQPSWTLPQDGRRRFAAMLRRVIFGGLAEAQHGKFGDILLADVLTSYSKVLGDLYVCLCMFFFTSRAGREASATDRPDRNCGGGVIVPLIMVMPFVARFRQCLIEYGRVRRAGAGGTGHQHLANAGKYATSFPVILFSALLRNAKAAAAAAPTAASDDSGDVYSPTSVFYYRLWLLAVAVNSLYSFYWDVAKDWDLTLFDGARARNAPDHAWGLRRRLLIMGGGGGQWQWQPLVYYGAIAADLVLRCTWSLKLSPHLDHVTDFESSLFVMQLLEVLRRWVWIFFRVETEWIRSTGGGSGSGSANGAPEFSGLLLGGGSASSSSSSSNMAGMNPTDILLGDYQAKYDDDD